MPKLLNILPTKTIIAAKYISTFNFCPKYANNIVSIAFPKKPETKTFASNLFFIFEAIAPNIESNAAIIATDKYIEYVYGIAGITFPTTIPKTTPININK